MTEDHAKATDDEQPPETAAVVNGSDESPDGKQRPRLDGTDPRNIRRAFTEDGAGFIVCLVDSEAGRLSVNAG